MNIQQVWVEKYGSAEVLSLKETLQKKDRELHSDEVMIKVYYSGINFSDLMMRQGTYPDAPKRPFVPGYEVSGEVIKVGNNVHTLKAGDFVACGTKFGGYSSVVVVPQKYILKVPKELDLEQAAALPVNLMTAYIALNEMARVRPGDRVLIDSASGGVGTLAIQLAISKGAQVVGLTTSAKKIEYIQSLGAQAYLQKDFKHNKKFNEFDIILNSYGGSTIKEQMQRLSSTGRLVAFGISAAVTSGKRDLFSFAKTILQMPIFHIAQLMNQNKGVYGLNVLHIFNNDRYLAKIMEEISQLKILPHVDKVFPAKDVAMAHRYLESKAAKGKVLLSWQ